MSNEVTKEAEETVENQDSVKQTNTENASEVKTEETKGATQEAQSSETATAEAAKAENAKAETANAKAETAKVEDKTSDAESDKADAEAMGDMDFGAILEQFEQELVSFHSGQMVNGKVVRVSDRGVLIDFGYKSEGVVSLEEFTDESGEVTIKKGEEVDVVIKHMGTGDAPPTLSRDDAQQRYSWDKIEEAYNNDEIIKGTVKEKTKGGLKVDVEGVEAFLPGSQIDSRPVRNLDSLKGEEIEAKVIKFSRKRNNIVISRKVLTDLVINEQKKETLDNIGEQHIVEGTVKNLTDYGAFIDIGGIDGLLHVTDMSWGRLQNPAELFKVGDHVQVKVLKLDRDKEKISLGYKQLIPDPWTTVTELYPVNEKITGQISSVTEYGAFVELEPGVEGLVHISEMSWSKRLKHPKHVVRKGEEVEVQVLGIDPDERRISLGIKQLQDNPWDTIGDRYFIGSKVQGKVRNLTDFGAFVEIEEGVDGLVHISDISWSRKIKHPKEVLSKGQEVEAVITSIDTSERRLSLSIKELTPSSWDQFTTDHKPGDVIKGKISRFAGFGVFVELAPELEGLCHISELSDERIENPEDKFEIGQELEFKILRIEHDVEKIGLSHRAVGKDDEVSTSSSSEGKSYSSQAKGGMASLGELAKLKFGGDKQADETPVEAKAENKEEKVAEEIKAEVVETEETADESKDDSAETDSKDSEVNAEAEKNAEAETKVEEKAESKDESADKAESDSEEVKSEVEETTETAETEKTEEVKSKTSETETKSEETASEDNSEAKAEESETAETAENTKSESKSDENKENTEAEEAKAETAETADEDDNAKEKEA